MDRVRLIYEQVETAKRHLLSGGDLECRLALILLDNAAELLMVRELQSDFSFEDFFYPPNRQKPPGRKLKWTPEERKRAEREFDPKLRILGFRLGRITPEERGILKVCHRLRNEAFHAGAIRRTVLSYATTLLFQTTVALTLKFPVRTFALPGPQEKGANASFLERFRLRDAILLGMPEGREQIAGILLEGIALDTRAFAQALSDDLTNRIDEDILGGLSYLNNRDADIDRNLQYGQFWQERGIAMAEAGLHQPEFDKAFEQWRAEGRAKYTVAKIGQWRRRSELLARRTNPATALEQWWAIDETMRPLETDINAAVADYDDRINMEINDRRR